MAVWLKSTVVLVTAGAAVWLAGCARVPMGAGRGGRPSRRYVREVFVPRPAEGDTCVALVPEIYERAVSAALNELAVFAVNRGGERMAVPFSLTESKTGTGDMEMARAFDVQATGGEVDFSLAMPVRAYSAVDLDVGARDFVGVAAVTGVNTRGGSTWLGQHVVFDETGRGLGRSMRMELAEERFPVLRVKVRMLKVDGRPWHGDGPVAVGAAAVPQSREAQTVYATVARTTDVMAGDGVEATLLAPAHVPVERVSFEVGGSEDFLREMTVTAGDDVVRGDIERLRLPGKDGAAATYEQLSLPAVLAANLRQAAEVRVRVEGAALPVRAVALEMRQRKACFHAGDGARYELAYGGDSLEGQPVSSNVSTAGMGTAGNEAVMEATLGPEREDASYAPPKAWKLWLVKQPELLWVMALGVVAVLAARMRLHLRQRGVR